MKKILKNKIEARHIYSIVMTALYTILICRCIYQYVNGFGLNGCKLEFLLMVISSFIVYIVSFLELDIFNKKQSKKKDKNLKKNKRNFIFESCFLSLTITTFLYLLIAYEIIYIDFYNMIPNQEALSIIGLAVVLFLVFFMISYLVTSKIYQFKVAKAK